MSMRLTRVAGTFNIGVNAVANESLAFITPDADAAFIKDVEEVLGVKPFQTTVSGSHVVGSLVVMNSNGAVLSGLAEESEVEVIRKCLPVLLLPDQYNAAGNNILVNDNGAVVNPEMDDRTAEKVAEILNVEVVKASVAGCNTVGSVCRCTNKGCVCSTDATDDEVEILREVLKVDVQRSTVNHGSKYIGAGILANSKGALVGDETTPIEMGRIEDGLSL